MRKITLLIPLGLLSGCMSAGPTPDQTAELNAVFADSTALVQAHKLSHAEAARRENEVYARVYAGRLTERDRLFLSYRESVSSQIDSGQITMETAKYLLQQRLANYSAQDRAADAAMLNAIGDSMRESENRAALRRPVTCNSVANGGAVSTTCF